MSSSEFTALGRAWIAFLSFDPLSRLKRCTADVSFPVSSTRLGRGHFPPHALLDFGLNFLPLHCQLGVSFRLGGGILRYLLLAILLAERLHGNSDFVGLFLRFDRPPCRRRKVDSVPIAVGLDIPV